MPGFHDVYVLARERTAAVAVDFLKAFTPNHEQSAENYVFPQYSNQPVVVIDAASDAIMHCETHPKVAQSFYFRNLATGPIHTMLFFTRDSGLILGLSVEDREDEWIAQLRGHADSKVGYIDFESTPPETVAEFRRLAASFG